MLGIAEGRAVFYYIWRGVGVPDSKIFFEG